MRLALLLTRERPMGPQGSPMRSEGEPIEPQKGLLELLEGPLEPPRRSPSQPQGGGGGGPKNAGPKNRPMPTPGGPDYFGSGRVHPHLM